MLKIIKDENILLSVDEKNTKELWHSIIAPILGRKIFEIDDEGLSKVVNSDVKDENIDDVKDAIDSCPTGAIEEDE